MLMCKFLNVCLYNSTLILRGEGISRRLLGILCISMSIMSPLENLIMGDTQEWDQQRPAYSGTVILPSISTVDTSTV